MLHRLALVWTAFIATVGCTPRLCDDQFSTSAGFTVTILDNGSEQGPFKYNPDRTAAYVFSTGSCAGLDGLASQASLQLRPTGTSDDPNHTCRRITASVVSLPGPAVLVADSAGAPAELPITGDVYAGADVTVQDCPGSVFLELFGASQAGPYAKPVPGGAPPAVLYRAFVPSGACLRTCDDNFDVQLTPN